jgi:hypothetical protein
MDALTVTSGLAKAMGEALSAVLLGSQHRRPEGPPHRVPMFFGQIFSEGFPTYIANQPKMQLALAQAGS